MAIVQISAKGQITIPADIRKKLGIEPRSRVDIEVQKNEIVIRRSSSVRELSGILHKYAKGKSTDWETIRSETYKTMAEEYAKRTSHSDIV